MEACRSKVSWKDPRFLSIVQQVGTHSFESCGRHMVFTAYVIPFETDTVATVTHQAPQLGC